MADPQYTPVRPCSAPNCSKPSETRKLLCSMHRYRMRCYGSLDLPTRATAPSIVGEEWRAVAEYEGIYEISNVGRVRRLQAACYSERGRILAPAPRKNGYREINLWRNNRGQWVGIHILVATAFIGPAPDGHEVNHKDRNRANNVDANLEWVTHRENMHHSLRARGLMRDTE